MAPGRPSELQSSRRHSSAFSHLRQLNARFGRSRPISTARCIPQSGHQWLGSSSHFSGAVQQRLPRPIAPQQYSRRQPHRCCSGGRVVQRMPFNVRRHWANNSAISAVRTAKHVLSTRITSLLAVLLGKPHSARPTNFAKTMLTSLIVLSARAMLPQPRRLVGPPLQYPTCRTPTSRSLTSKPISTMAASVHPPSVRAPRITTPALRNCREAVMISASRSLYLGKAEPLSMAAAQT